MCVVEVENFIDCVHQSTKVVPCIMVNDKYPSPQYSPAETTMQEESMPHQRYERVEIQVMSACNICILLRVDALSRKPGTRRSSRSIRRTWSAKLESSARVRISTRTRASSTSNTQMTGERRQSISGSQHVEESSQGQVDDRLGAENRARVEDVVPGSD